jgi:hypothetical protein
MNWPTFILAYAVTGYILNDIIDFRFVDPKGEHPNWDKWMTFIYFKVLWPIGLIVFIIKWMEGKGDVNGRKRGE